jgi:hypothetical protein
VQLFGGTASAQTDDTALGYVIILVADGKVLKETLSKKQSRAR